MKENWITIKTKGNAFVKVFQPLPFSDYLLDENGNKYRLDQVDMSERYFIFKSTTDNEEVESGLDGHRAIYG